MLGIAFAKLFADAKKGKKVIEWLLRLQIHLCKDTFVKLWQIKKNNTRFQQNSSMGGYSMTFLLVLASPMTKTVLFISLTSSLAHTCWYKHYLQ